MKVEHYSASAESGVHPEVANISNGTKLCGSGFWIVAVVLPETSGLGNLTTVEQTLVAIKTTETIDGDGMVCTRTIDISSHWKRTVVTSKQSSPQY